MQQSRKIQRKTKEIEIKSYSTTEYNENNANTEKQMGKPF